ncbi:MAG: hypothetical protein ACM3NQ_11470 [Bacteroidales bacterium]
MSRHAVCVALLAVVVAIAGCSSSPSTTQPTTTSPSAPTVAIGSFAGSWTSALPTSGPSSCSQHDYTITPTGDNAATVTYKLACGGYQVEGTGSGTLVGSTLTWNAKGTLAGNGLPCPSPAAFEFKNSTATLQADNQVLVAYNAVVCGVTFSGSQMLKKR